MYKNNTNTNITVEKIDTTETQNTLKKKEKKNKKDKKDKKFIKSIEEQNIKEHLDSLDELSLVLSNVSENYEPSNMDTNTLINRSEGSKKKSKKNRIILNFPKNTITDNYIKYNIINNYVKKNITMIQDLLYQKNIIKNKNIPYRLLFHIYVNYLNNDLNLVFQ